MNEPYPYFNLTMKTTYPSSRYPRFDSRTANAIVSSSV